MPLRLPLDGNLSIDLSFPAGAPDDIALYRKAGTRVLARGAPSGASSEKLTYLNCGERSASLKVTSRGAPGRFEVRIARP